MYRDCHGCILPIHFNFCFNNFMAQFPTCNNFMAQHCMPNISFKTTFWPKLENLSGHHTGQGVCCTCVCACNTYLMPEKVLSTCTCSSLYSQLYTPGHINSMCTGQMEVHLYNHVNLLGSSIFTSLSGHVMLCVWARWRSVPSSRHIICVV